MVRSDRQDEHDEQTSLGHPALVDRLAKTKFGVVPILNTESIPSFNRTSPGFGVMTSTHLPEIQD